MSIQNQALFFENSICDITDNMAEQAGLSGEMVKGMKAYTKLLRRIYKDYKVFEFSTAESVPTKIGILKDDLENYHHLTDTTLCLYGLACAGTVMSDGVESYLSVSKIALKQAFKKPAQKYFGLLEQFGLSFAFYKKEAAVKTYSSADTVRVSYPSCPEMLLAIKYLSDRVPQTDVKKDYADAINIYRLADYESLVLQKSTLRASFSPMHPSILNVLGEQKTMWGNLVHCLCEDVGLQTDVSLNTYVSPNWIVKFIYKMKTICTAHIRCNQIYIRLPLSYLTAKYAIDQRSDLPVTIQNAIEKFGCVGCGKCTNRCNLEDYKGIQLCRLSYKNFVTEDSRMIQFMLTQDDELFAIVNMIKKELGE